MLKNFFDMVRQGALPFILCHHTHGWFGEVDGIEIRIHWIYSSRVLSQGPSAWAAIDDDVPF